MAERTREEFMERLVYVRISGEFYWKTGVNAGERAGYAGSEVGRSGRRYWIISIFGKKYKAHRLAWLFEKGEWPSQVIDHKNRNTLDNRIENLRDVPQMLNNQNKGNNRLTEAWRGFSLSPEVICG